jgi:uncharacterized damage-inducible protein DinB
VGQQAQGLLEQFEQANREFIEAIERCSAEQWRKVTEAEGWSVGVTAHHVAEGWGRGAARLEALASGKPVPVFGTGTLDERNAAHAQQFANVSKEEALPLLRRNAQTAANVLRNLDDSALDSLDTSANPPRSGRQWAEITLITHPRSHLQSLKTVM